MATVSVIIPTYNRVQLLTKAVASVMAQTMTDWELIISDDGSTDETLDHARSLAFQHANVILVRGETNQGVAWAIRRGVEAAKAKRFALLSDDDEYRPTYLETLSAALDANPDYDMVYSGVWVEYWDTIFGGMAGQASEMQLGYPGELPYHNVVWGFMANRSMYDALGGWPTRFKIANDWDFFLTAYASGMRLLRITDPLYVYRYWMGGQTFTDRQRQLDESNRIIELYRQGLMDVRVGERHGR